MVHKYSKMPGVKLPNSETTLYANLQLQFAMLMLDPDTSKDLVKIAKRFNARYGERGIRVTHHLLRRWMKDPVYVARKNAMISRLEDQYSADIDMKLIQKCLSGSYPHMSLWYNKRGQLINRNMNVTPDKLPTKKSEVDKEIQRLIEITTPRED